MEFKDMLNVALIPFAALIAAACQVLKNWWTGSVSGEVPKYVDPLLGAVAGMLSWLVVARVLLYIDPSTPHGIVTDVPLQVFVLWVETVAVHFLARGIYGSGRPPATADDLRSYLGKADPEVVAKAGVTMTAVKVDDRSAIPPTSFMIALGIGLLLACSTAHAQPNTTVYRDGQAYTEPDSSLVAFWRLSGYVDAKASVLQSKDMTPFTAFVPGAGLSYGLTTDASIVAGGEYAPQSGAMWGNLGARMRTYQSGSFSLWLGVDAVWPNDKAKEILGYTRDHHTRLSIRSSSPIARKKDGSAAFLAVAAAMWAPDERVVVNGLDVRRKPEFTVGLRYQAFGGVPNVKPVDQ